MAAVTVLKVDVANAIVDNGNVVGYRVLYPEMPEPDNFVDLPTIMLYQLETIEALYSEGYKIYDRNGNIETPDGKAIADLPSIPFSSIDMIRWGNSSANTHLALSDADCAKYYTIQDNSPLVELRTESSYEINTREEFINYLNAEKALFEATGRLKDYRPINAIVSPAALFTIDEIEKDSLSIVPYLDLLHERHNFPDYSQYKKVVEFMYNRHAIDTLTPTTFEFIKAYYSWGAEGITGKCTDIKYKYAADGPFFSDNDVIVISKDSGLDETTARQQANRHQVMSIVDRQGNLRHLRHVNNLRDKLTVLDFDRDRLAFVEDRILMSAKRPDFGGFNFYPYRAFMSDISDRIYITYISSTGYKYYYKVAHNAVFLSIVGSRMRYFSKSSNFTIRTIAGGVRLTLEDLKTDNDYAIWNVAAVESSKYVKTNTKTAPVLSSTELYTRAGMSPIEIAKYMINHIISYKNVFPANEQLFSGRYFGLLDNNAIFQFSEGVPEHVIKAFKVEPSNAGSWAEFMDNADPDLLLDIRDKMDSDMIHEGDDDWDDTYVTLALQQSYRSTKSVEEKERLGREIEYKKSRDALKYYANAKAVLDCIQGNICIDGFGSGIISDLEESSPYDRASFYVSLVYAICGDDPSITDAMNVIRTAHDREINPQVIYRKREAAYNGFVADLCYVLNKKANIADEGKWGYITKAFREVGNIPMTEARPYLCELLVIDSKNKYTKPIIDAMYNVTIEQINEMNYSDELIFGKDFGNPYANKSLKDIAKMAAYYYVSVLLFTLLASKESTDAVVTQKISMIDGNVLTYEFDQATYQYIRRFAKDLRTTLYSTVYDLNMYSYNQSAESHVGNEKGIFQMHIVNAAITPWSIIPHVGFNVKSLPLLPSWFAANALIDKNGRPWYVNGVEGKLIVDQPISELDYTRCRFPKIQPDEYEMLKMDFKDAQTVSDLDCFYEDTLYEPIEVYIKRQGLAKREAREKGYILKRVPLKQDILMSEYASALGFEDIPTGVEFMSGEDNTLTELDTYKIKAQQSVKQVQRIESGIKHDVQKIPQYEISGDVMMKLLQLVNAGHTVFMYRRVIIGAEKIFVGTMTDQQFRDFVANNCIDYNGMHLFVGMDGIYSIGE